MPCPFRAFFEVDVAVDGDHGDQNQADDHVLQLHLQQAEHVGQQGHEQRAGDCAQCAALAVGKAAAADDAGDHAGHVDALAQILGGALDARHAQHARQRGQKAAQRIDTEHDLPVADAHLLRGLLIAADKIQAAAGGTALQEEPEQRQHDQHDPCHDVQAEELAVAQRDEAVGQLGGLGEGFHAVPDGHGHAVADVLGADGCDQRIDTHIRHQPAVDRAHGHAGEAEPAGQDARQQHGGADGKIKEAADQEHHHAEAHDGAGRDARLQGIQIAHRPEALAEQGQNQREAQRDGNKLVFANHSHDEIVLHGRHLNSAFR